MPASASGQKPYLRLRGGRKVRTSGVGGFIQFHEFRRVAQTSAIFNITLRNASSVTKWQYIISGAPYTVNDILTVTGAPTGRCAVASVRSKAFLYNGKGVRASDSQPPFSSWDGTTVRYVGLDAYCPSGTPIASFAAGAGHNTIISFVSIYVGLMNSTTQHFSNAVFAGTLSTPGTGTISVGSLNNLVPVYNNGTEQGELFYVFYASIDGGQTAYQIMNVALTGPYKVAISTTTTDLSLSSLVPQGFILDLTQERPITNYPPRPMSLIAYANGRVYGVLQGGGTGAAVVLPDSGGNYYKDFTYVNGTNDDGAIAWSASADDSSQNDFVGVPEEAWPISNRKFTPKAEQPVIIDAAPGGNQLLVVTTNGTFLLYEAADGLHQWVTISDTDGGSTMNNYVQTPRGPMWLTQKQQIVLLNKDTFQLEKLSEGFDELLSSPLSYGPTGVCADYLWDPHHLIDYYEVWRADGSSVVYDFAIGGMAYEKTGPSISAAKTMFMAGGLKVHLMGGNDLYTQEADPTSGQIYTRDEITTGVFTQISGDWISQWVNLGDSRNRERFTDMDIIGDGAVSAIISASPLAFTFYVDLTSTVYTPTLAKSNQSTTDNNYKARTTTTNAFWIKFRVQLAGHTSVSEGTILYPETVSFDGELTPAIFHSILDIAPSLNFTGNRP